MFSSAVDLHLKNVSQGDVTCLAEKRMAGLSMREEVEGVALPRTCLTRKL